MPRADGFVRVDGLRELQKALRQVDRDLPKQLGDANQTVARHVVTEATAAAGRLGPGFARAAKSLSAARQQRIAAVKLGGARYPDAMGWEFGAVRNIARQTRRGRVRGWNQFRPHRGSGSGAGYFLYPTIRREGDRIVELYAEVLDDLLARAFPD